MGKPQRSPIPARSSHNKNDQCQHPANNSSASSPMRMNLPTARHFSAFSGTNLVLPPTMPTNNKVTVLNGCAIKLSTAVGHCRRTLPYTAKEGYRCCAASPPALPLTQAKVNR